MTVNYKYRRHALENTMSRARFLVFVVLLLGSGSWGIRPTRFRKILETNTNTSTDTETRFEGRILTGRSKKNLRKHKGRSRKTLHAQGERANLDSTLLVRGANLMVRKLCIVHVGTFLLFFAEVSLYIHCCCVYVTK